MLEDFLEKVKIAAVENNISLEKIEVYENKVLLEIAANAPKSDNVSEEDIDLSRYTILDSIDATFTSM